MTRSGPPPLRRLVVPGLFVAALFVVSFLRQSSGPQHQRELLITGPTMGTIFNVKVVTDDQSQARRSRLTDSVQEVVDAIDDAMSTYRRESEIEAFNRGGTEVFAASQAMIEVVAEAQRVARLSGGALDITVGPLVDRWGFGPNGAMDPPGDDDLKDLMAATGHDKVEIDVEDGTLRKTLPAVRIDLSAVAKGYAVDRVSEALARQGLPDHLVEIGGEVRARGVNGSGAVWKVGVERPTSGERSVQVAVQLDDVSLATSGDYRNYIERDGVRYSHTIDPRTGRPVTHNLASVSVIHSSCMSADALATAFEVLGPDEGHALAESMAIPALFQVRTAEDTFEQRPTAAWVAITEN